MSKADNVGKAARSNTTAAARKQYSKTGPRAARAKKGAVVPAVAAPATGKAAAKAAAATKPDYAPPPAIDHSAQATDTPPPAIDKNGQRVE
jgi:hypothetical protein